MSSLLSPPSQNDIIGLLKAWRFWTLGAVIGALIGAAVYYVVPPTYQARATVNMDFNLEQAWPAETDRQQFYYLERETRKLIEIAWSDDVMQALSSELQVPVEELRGGKLQLSQPAESGWHFYAQDKAPELASGLASAWALLFEEHVRENIAKSSGLNSFIQVDATQTQELPVERSTSLGTYLSAGSVLFLAAASIGVLFFYKPE